jgi:hypothetical protein
MLLHSITILLVFSCVACNHEPEIRLSKEEIAALPKTTVPNYAKKGSLNYWETAELPAGFRFIKKEFHRDDDAKINIAYPQIVSGSNRITSAINKRIWNLAIQEYEPDIKPSRKIPRAEQHEYQLQLSRKYSLELINDEVVSLVFHEWWYGIGAAHGDGKYLTLNFNLKTGKPVKLRELFKPGSRYLERLQGICEQALVLQTGSELTSELSLKLERNIEWHLTKDRLCIDFPRCEPIPCASGEQIVAISYVDLKDILNLEGVLKSVIAP